MPVIHLARKPLSEGSITQNVLVHGTGGIHIDATRIASDGSHRREGVLTRRTVPSGDDRNGAALGWGRPGQTFIPSNHPGGRWPANMIFQHLDSCTQEDQVWSCATGCPVPTIEEARFFKHVI